MNSCLVVTIKRIWNKGTAFFALFPNKFNEIPVSFSERLNVAWCDWQHSTLSLPTQHVVLGHTAR